MAARRILSLLAEKIPQEPISKGLTRDFHPTSNSFSNTHARYTRGFQTLTESTAATPAVENPNEPESHQISNELEPIITETSIQHRVNSSLKVSQRHDLVMTFTCRVCDTRTIKTACRESYDKGVVVARCDGCNNLHLIADRLGWFGEPGSIEEFLAARGEQVKKGSMDTFNLTLEDLAGKKN